MQTDPLSLSCDDSLSPCVPKGRGLAIWVIVSNCSDQMNNKVTGQFFSGLAQTGAWGCFDEFNRITVEVLSVVAGQYGSILEGIRAGKSRFIFEEEEINLVPSIGAWITMNPGYAGRAELPENLKALFRPCAMVTHARAHSNARVAVRPLPGLCPSLPIIARGLRLVSGRARL